MKYLPQIVAVCSIGYLLGCAQMPEHSAHHDAPQATGAQATTSASVKVKTKPAKPKQFENTTWELVSIGEEVISLPKQPTLELKNKKITSFTGCNGAMGGYKVTKTGFQASELATTRMLCDDASNKVEFTYARLLPMTHYVSRVGDQLILENGEQTLTFKVKK